MSPRSHRTGKARRFGGDYAFLYGAVDWAGVPAAALLMHKCSECTQLNEEQQVLGGILCRRKKNKRSGSIRRPKS